MDQLPRLGKRELICLLLFTCSCVVSVWRGFLFLWVLGMGCVILLWHSLSLPYNYLSYLILSYLTAFTQCVKMQFQHKVKKIKSKPTLNGTSTSHRSITVNQRSSRQLHHYNPYTKRLNSTEVGIQADMISKNVVGEFLGLTLYKV